MPARCGCSTSDYYGGYRPGNNLYANSIVPLDAKTGRRVGRFQLTHHDLRDFDPPTAPILVDITVEGRPIKAVAQLIKQGFASAGTSWPPARTRSATRASASSAVGSHKYKMWMRYP